MGVVIRSVKWIGLRSLYRSARSGYGPTSVCSYCELELVRLAAAELLEVGDPEVRRPAANASVNVSAQIVV